MSSALTDQRPAKPRNADEVCVCVCVCVRMTKNWTSPSVMSLKINKISQDFGDEEVIYWFSLSCSRPGDEDMRGN